MGGAVAKSDLRTKVLNSLFSKRELKARQEYLDAVAGSPYEHMSVIYKFKIFDPNPKGKKKSGFYEVPEGSEHGRKLDRLIRVIDDIDLATKHLTYILNFIEHEEEFNYLLGLSDKQLDPVIQCKLDKFKEDNKKLFTTLNKLKLLSDIV